MKSTACRYNAPNNNFGAGFTDNDADMVKPKSIVVKPPEKFYRFSVYDELNLDRNTFAEFISRTDPKTYKSYKRKKKLQKAVLKIVNFAIASLAVFLAYKNRAVIKNTALKAFNGVKNLIK